MAKKPFTHHVLSRFTMECDRADPASEKVLLEGDDQALVKFKQAGGHQGGPLRFGPDGCLYVGLGEQTAGAPAQRLDSLLGKILRLRPDGQIPEDNPFFTQTTGKHRAIWALGIRNPFGLAFEPGTGRLWATDVGQTSWEEVNVIERGGNYGWPRVEGVGGKAEFRDPVHAYPPAIGRSICGGVFYPRDGGFPEPWKGKFFFVDWAANWMKALDPAKPENPLTFAKNLNAPVAVEPAPDGSLLVLNRATIWRDNKNHRPKSGSLIRIRYVGGGVTLADGQAFPPDLTATGLFDGLAPLQPRADFVSFAINHEPWLPGVKVSRWMSLPAGQEIGFSATDEWSFPAGAVLVQHFRLANEREPDFETHVLWFTGPRVARAAAYRWKDGATSLAKDADFAALPGQPARRWLTPGVETALALDQIVAGFHAPVNARQLHRDGQLQQWKARGWFGDQVTDAMIESVAPLASLLGSAPAEVRVRSYLDVHCAQCHRPGGPARGNFDARFLTPLAEQGLLHGNLIATDVGVPGAKIVLPGQPEKSALLLRLKRVDFLRMPPIAFTDEPTPALPALEEWIRGLAR